LTVVHSLRSSLFIRTRPLPRNWAQYLATSRPTGANRGRRRSPSIASMAGLRHAQKIRSSLPLRDFDRSCYSLLISARSRSQSSTSLSSPRGRASFQTREHPSSAPMRACGSQTRRPMLCAGLLQSYPSGRVHCRRLRLRSTKPGNDGGQLQQCVLDGKRRPFASDGLSIRGFTTHRLGSR